MCFAASSPRAIQLTASISFGRRAVRRAVDANELRAAREVVMLDGRAHIVDDSTGSADSGARSASVEIAIAIGYLRTEANLMIDK